MAKEAGHSFLARLGKKRLRPGGKAATDWLIRQTSLTEETKVLEVGCNMGTTMIDLAKHYGCTIIGIDRDEVAVRTAQQNILANHVTELVSVQRGNATKLPFADESFDLIINEAMLTMLPPASKERALKEYFRVLKPNGTLVTHDVCLRTANQAIVEQLSATIHVHVHPLTQAEWEQTFRSVQFHPNSQTGPMSLMNPIGLIQDEGLFGALKIVKNGLKVENRPTFLKMFRFFKQHRQQLGYIAIVSKKIHDQSIEQ